MLEQVDPILKIRHMYFVHRQKDDILVHMRKKESV